MPKRQCNGIELYYETSGEGQPVLFIHGLGSSTRDWEYQTPFFSKQYQVVTFDLRGHGQTEKPPGPYAMSQFASDAAALIQSLNLPPVHVVGLSLGGMVAFQMAVDHPQLVRSLVIVNSGPELVIRTLKDRWRVFMRFLIVRLLGMRKMGEVLSKRLFPKADQTELAHTFIERWAENDRRAYTDAMRAIVGWSVAQHLPNLHIPTLVLSGDQDYTPVTHKEVYVAQMPQAELVVIPDSRHVTPVDQPELFNQAIISFWTRPR